MKTKNQKGITLIALVITIIVMLILVGVSVSVALNTGLFKTAQGAAKNTELAADAENTLSTGWITVKNETTGNLDKVHMSSFGQTIEELEDDAISLSENPTHVLKFHGKTYEIDSTTTFDKFMNACTTGMWSGVSPVSTDQTYDGRVFFTADGEDAGGLYAGYIFSYDSNVWNDELGMAEPGYRTLVDFNGYYCVVDELSDEVYAKFEILEI